LDKTKQIFVVGNSRSGTTMMGRIIGKHSSVFTFKELHFFGQLWSSKDKNKLLSRKESVKLFSKLLNIQQYGIFNQRNPEQFNTISESSISEEKYSRINIFNFFLHYSAEQNNSVIPCDQSPINVLYIQEILDNFPNAKIVNMVRDPRDVLLSQKNKWKRRYFGSSSIPFKEAVRSYFNYHPITISKLWNSSINNARKFEKNERVFSLKFENLLENPEKKIQDLCDFLGLEFSEEMLKVPNIGSSTSVDEKTTLGLDNNKIGKWKSGGISKTDIYICQKICGNNMATFHYKKKNFKFIPLFVIFQFFSFPIKLSISFLLNLHRIKNLKEVFKKRILNS